MAKVRRRRPSRPPLRRRATFLRKHREAGELTLERLAAAVGTTHATLSRLERGLAPYGQDLLERLAHELGTEPADILARDPANPDGIWTVWGQATPSERHQIVEIAKTIIKTRA